MGSVQRSHRSARSCCKEVRKIAINFFKWLTGSRRAVTISIEEKCKELYDAAAEYSLLSLCYGICVDMIANALGRCEFRTYMGNEETQGSEYYLWNIEPNVNQNSTMFLHKLVHQLYWKNEALVVTIRRRDTQGDALIVADSWAPPEDGPARRNEYKSVTVGEFAFSKTFSESDVLHLKLNHVDIKPYLTAVSRAYARMVTTAQTLYTWDRGQHWKVHVAGIANGDDDFMKNFAAYVDKQVKPFFNNQAAVLPEFDGWAFEPVQSSGNTSSDTRDIRAMIEDVFDFTARTLMIPAVLVNGTVEGTADANARFLSYCIDPLCDQLQEEIVRKRYGYDEWRRGNTLRVDSSSILHFDLFANAPNIEKIIGSGTFTINDVRRAANQAPIDAPWANESHMTLNIARTDQATRTLSTEGESNDA